MKPSRPFNRRRYATLALSLVLALALAALGSALADRPADDPARSDASLGAYGVPGGQALCFWSPDGRLVWQSPNVSRTGLAERGRAARSAARSGRTVLLETSGRRRLHVFVAIATPRGVGRSVGAYELAVDPSASTARAAGDAARRRRDLLIGAALLWLALLPLVRRLVRRLADDRPARNAITLWRVRRALKRDRLELHFQPKLDVATNEMIGAEALLRLRRLDGSIMPPAMFLPAVESSRLIGPVTDRVLERAIAQVGAWWRADRVIPVAVNLSPTLLDDPTLAARIGTLLERHRVAPGLLTLEITETAVIADHAAAEQTLAELAALGIGLSVDDFGTGYSSLERVSRYPFTELKIDRSFVQDARLRDRPILAATVQMARALGLRVVAEGVEDRATLALLRAVGCHEAQGYFFARPMPAGDLLGWRAPAPDGHGPCEALLADLCASLGMDLAFIAEFTDGQQVVRASSDTMPSPDPLALCDSYCQRVFDGVFPNVIGDTAAHLTARNLAVTRSWGIGAYIGTPLYRRDGTLYGSLCCISSSARPELSDADLAAMRDTAELLHPHLDGADLRLATAE